jgi:hypothetical protein
MGAEAILMRWLLTSHVEAVILSAMAMNFIPSHQAGIVQRYDAVKRARPGQWTALTAREDNRQSTRHVKQ